MGWKILGALATHFDDATNERHLQGGGATPDAIARRA